MNRNSSIYHWLLYRILTTTWRLIVNKRLLKHRPCIQIRSLLMSSPACQFLQLKQIQDYSFTTEKLYTQIRIICRAYTLGVKRRSHCAHWGFKGDWNEKKNMETTTKCKEQQQHSILRISNVQKTLSHLTTKFFLHFQQECWLVDLRSSDFLTLLVAKIIPQGESIIRVIIHLNEWRLLRNDNVCRFRFSDYYYKIRVYQE